MLFYFTSRIISSVSAFLYPGYASYKTLSQRPASEEELERWLMYWSVLGCIVGVEYVAEWMISWIPMYYFTKTLFLLYLSLPQTHGSTYLYRAHLQPFFQAHEHQIDKAIAEMKKRVYTFLQTKARAIWDQLSASAGIGSASPTSVLNEDQGAPPTLSDPVSGPAQLAGTLWRSYGPSIMASGAALLKQATAPTTSSTFTVTPTPSGFSSRTTTSVLERRRQLEAELAALSATSDSPPPLSPRERTTSTGRFEEIEIPSDVEGYDVGQGHSYDRPAAQKRGSSWFGWSAS
ncbi:TB2/DP1, HVA22 family-domain-containing protein, partial [Mucidula mucida]